VTRFVADASVAVKWFLNEADTPRAMALLNRGAELCAPQLLRVEIAAAIVRRFRTGGLDLDDARERLAEAAAAASEPRISFWSDSDLLPRACAIALQIKHPLQDCVYLACAEHVGGELVTADATLFKRAQPHFNFVTWL